MTNEGEFKNLEERMQEPQVNLSDSGHYPRSYMDRRCPCIYV